MKAIRLILLGALLSVSSLYAQLPTMPLSLDKADSLDLVQYRVLYRLDLITDPEDLEFITQDFVRLDIGNSVSKEYSQKLYQADSLAKTALEAGKLPRWVNDLVPPLVLYKGYPSQQEITIDYRLPSKAPVMTYTEAKPALQWLIHKETKELLGYPCQKAEVSFGGRQWTAWFTPDIPLPEGPYKFGGLPGLILELVDAQNHYHYTAVSISNVLGAGNVVRWDWKQRATNKKELDKILRQLYANPDQALKALGTPTRFAGDAMLDLPYNPIER